MQKIGLIFLVVLSLLITSAGATTLYIDIGVCTREDSPDVSFKIFVDGDEADSARIFEGFLLFAEIEGPDDEPLSLAASTLLERQDDRSLKFDNVMFSAPGEDRFLLKQGETTRNRVGDLTFLCRGKSEF